ncbi:hypothetical protein QJS10_CPB15g00435 [Acorus calamus]|uniref:TFIIS N-terminal domain-containing protein n=1 Tax=Acorus calamus TaxID=4465 RepID=A0AAV9D6S3_ACOCL|nr:hypothetical protein QJS10_CPB15g00435 [Acorus calamus]
MKDGLSNLARVEELVSVMKKKKDHAIGNVGEAARQWSTVAGILLATENKDCLHHFIHLDGLQFLSQWLQEAHKCGTDISDGLLEESINALLAALNKLMDAENCTVSGIAVTINHLLSHKSLTIQEKARVLLEKLNWVMEKERSSQDKGDGGTCRIDDPPSLTKTCEVGECGSLEDSVLDISLAKGAGEGKNGVGSGSNDSFHSASVTVRSSDSSQVDAVKNVLASNSIQDATLGCSNPVDAGTLSGEMTSVGSSVVSNPCQENLSVTEESSLCPAGGMVSSTSPSERNVRGKTNASGLKDAADGIKYLEVDLSAKDGACKSDQKELKSARDACMSCDLDAKDSKPYTDKAVRTEVACDPCISEHPPNNVTVDIGIPKYLRGVMDQESAGRSSSNLQDPSSKMIIQKKQENPDASVLKEEPVGSISTVKVLVNKSKSKKRTKLDHAVQNNLSRKRVDSKDADEIGRTGVGKEFDEFGDDDALAVARQVAMEVVREVEDYREPHSSSSPDGGRSEGEVTNSSSSDSGNNHDEPEQSSESDSPSEKDLSNGTSPAKENCVEIAEDTHGTDHEKANNDSGSFQITAVVVPKSVADDERCFFDLNEDLVMEETECALVHTPTSQSGNLSAPIPVVATSKGTPVLPASPLHFEGVLGWKGSAATSAFHPPSPRRTPDRERRQTVMQFDLNVPDEEEDSIMDPVLLKQVPLSSSLPSGESSIEVSSRRAERLNLDLNSIGDNEEPPSYPSSSHWKADVNHHHQNRNRSPSPASSSSSRQPSIRNFDLNDKPAFLEGLGSRNPWFELPIRPTDDPAMSIMGSSMAVERRELPAQIYSFLPPRIVSEPLMDVSTTAQAGLAYSHMPPPLTINGYNGFTISSAMSFPPALYGHGPGPYIVDARGAPVLPPQIMGSSASSRPPFFMGVGGPSSSNGVGVFRPVFDLNSIDGGNRPPFMQAPGGGLMGEQMVRSASQPAGAVGFVGMKRKEPEPTWESHAVGYKQMTLWH